MRYTLSLVCLVLFLAVATPAQAQLRQDVHSQRAPVKLFDHGGAGYVLNQIFSPEHFRMQHSYEMSIGSFGGQSSSLGMYTNSMMWQFNEKLAARVDIAFAHSPFGNALGSGNGGIDGNGGRVFLRNAEVAYRPSERVNLHFSIHQSPYGPYMGPYGYYNMGPYGYHPYYGGGFSSRAFIGAYDGGDHLFWKDRR